MQQSTSDIGLFVPKEKQKWWIGQQFEIIPNHLYFTILDSNYQVEEKTSNLAHGSH
jgi:hypothetical protein